MEEWAAVRSDPIVDARGWSVSSLTLFLELEFCPSDETLVDIIEVVVVIDEVDEVSGDTCWGDTELGACFKCLLFLAQTVECEERQFVL